MARRLARWAEVTEYAKASFAINADTTIIGGAFLASSATKGANGSLLCVAAFTGR